MRLRTVTRLALVFPWIAALSACPSDDAATGEGGSSESGESSSGTSPTTTIDPTVGMTEMTADSSGTMTVADTTDSDPTGTESSDSSESSTTAPPNEPPAATDDVLYTLQDQVLDLAAAGVLDNDEDPDGDDLQVVASDAMSTGGGTVVVGEDGAVTYTPAAAFIGDDTFTYTVSDGEEEASATVTVYVAPTLVALGTVVDGVGGFVIDGATEGQEAGNPCSVAGDFDGDGLDDIVLAEFAADAPGPDAGRAYVVYGKNGDTDAVVLSDVAEGNGGLVLDGTVSETQTGRSVSNIGDFNGDGLDDVAIGAPGDVIDNSQEGLTYVVFGRDDGIAEVLVDDLLDGVGGFAFLGEFVNDLAGRSVGAAGDVNGDGLADLVIGAPGLNPDSPSPADAGRTYVVFGRAEASPTIDLSSITAGIDGFAITGEADSDFSGIAARGAGDVNGDGLADIVLGAFGADPSGTNSGRAYVVFGKDGDTDEVLLLDVTDGVGGFTIDGEATSDVAGFSVSGAGDFDGDGLADIVIGASGSNANGNDSGRAYFVFGKADTTLVELTSITAGVGGFTLTGEAAGDNLGGSVAAAGDVNGDGLGDVILGAPFSDASAVTAGRTYVVYGRSDGEASTFAEIVQGIGGFALDGEALQDVSGIVVNGGGDIDGDGFDDIVLNAAGSDTEQENAGRTYVVFGVPTAPAR